MVRWVRPLAIAVVVLGSVTMPHRARAQGAASMRITLPAEVTLGQPVMLWYAISNDSPGPLTIDLGYDRRGSFEFVLTRPDGTTVRGQPRERDGGSSVPELKLDARAEYRRAIVVNEWVPFDLSGSYTLDVEFHGSVRGARLAVTGTHQRIVVTPYNRQVLEARCRALLDEIKSLQRYHYDEKWWGLAAELAWMRDPVAVPYLEEALKSELILQGMGVFPFDTLVEIGTVEAKAALTRLSLASEPMVARAAQNALKRFKLRR